MRQAPPPLGSPWCGSIAAASLTSACLSPRRPRLPPSALFPPFSESIMNDPVADGGFRECTFRSQDDLLLYWRDYGDFGLRLTPVLFLPVLMRNFKYFQLLARQLCLDRWLLV